MVGVQICLRQRSSKMLPLGEKIRVFLIMRGKKIVCCRCHIHVTLVILYYCFYLQFLLISCCTHLSSTFSQDYLDRNTQYIQCSTLLERPGTHRGMQDSLSCPPEGVVAGDLWNSFYDKEEGRGVRLGRRGIQGSWNTGFRESIFKEGI